ncbi:MAG: S49 family peptidase [Gammaproteobacteria bacterium]|nr:S49 family peptidase [Gammaproteobacteria bacterium]
MSDNQQESSSSAPVPGGGDQWTAGPPVEPAKRAGEGGDAEWERGVLKKLVFSAVEEQRRTRRWGIFFKSLTFIYLFVVLYLLIPAERAMEVGKKHTALVEVRGEIADDSEANADSIVSGLRAAFEDRNTAGVILRINSPGGSPVQAGYVNDEIKRLRSQYPDIPLYAVVTDICASGGYYIAAAADKIYADKASLVGSIGVIMDGFGFVDTMKKLGVERRLMTAGEHKGFLDPFSPQKPEEVDHVKTLLGTIHKQFIDTVKKGRGDRLKDEPNLFSGYIWTGEQAVDIGLVDALGSSSYVAREVIKAENIVDYTERPPYLQQLTERFGMAMAKAFSSVSGAGLKQAGDLVGNLK